MKVARSGFLMFRFAIVCIRPTLAVRALHLLCLGYSKVSQSVRMGQGIAAAPGVDLGGGDSIHVHKDATHT